MKKYKMRIKDDKAEYGTYGLDVCHRKSGGFVWLCDGVFSKYTSTKCESQAREFTMEEIEKMPYGFVNQYDLIEVKEQLYTVNLGDGLHLVKNNKEVYISTDRPNKRHTFELTKSEIENSKHSVLMAIADKVDM